MPNPYSLARRLGLASATAIVVSNMIGTGIFTTTGFLAGDLGTPFLVMFSWVVGAGCALLGAICYSELAINFPTSGGEYVYLSRAYGKTWGFLTGWVSLFAGFSAPIAAAALAFASYLVFLFPRWKSSASQGTAFQFGHEQFIACALVALFSFLNVFGIRRIAMLQNVLTALKIALLVAFMCGGLLVGRGDWLHFSQAAVRWTATPVWRQFAVSLFWIYVAYSGWNAAVYVAEEIEEPRRTLSRTLALGTAIVAILYLALNAVFIYATPLPSMKGVIAIGALASSHLFGMQAAGVFSGLMACCLLSTVNAMTIAGPRVYYAMARDGQFFSFAATVHPRWRTPVNSIVVQAICTIVLIFTPFPQLVVYIGFTLNLFAVMSVAALFLFRQRPGWQRMRSVSFLYPLIPCLFVAVGVWMIVEGVIQKPLISMLAVLTLALGGVLYKVRGKSPSVEKSLDAARKSARATRIAD